MKKSIYFLLAALVLSFAACKDKNEPSDNTQNDEPVNSNFVSKPFSVGASKTVYFSQGNLQYRASTNRWRFAPQQYARVGEYNSNISETSGYWIDLFGWGTSGYNGKFPYMISLIDTDYGEGNNNIAGTNYDWGVYNPINNGGKQADLWRTLKRTEWDHLFNTRTDAAQLQGQATVNGVQGYIILPDNWSTPAGLTFTAVPKDWTTNTYDIDNWLLMEAAGAVFLPTDGYRRATKIFNIDDTGTYWTTARKGTHADSAYCVAFYKATAMKVYSVDRHRGFSVRLVQDVK